MKPASTATSGGIGGRRSSISPTALEIVPSDQPSKIFIDRCRYYNDNPPPENWNGVWIMEDK